MFDTRLVLFSKIYYNIKKTKQGFVDSKNMAVPTGIEPAISCVTGRHVNRYTTGPLVAGTGFEPATFGL